MENNSCVPDFNNDPFTVFGSCPSCSRKLNTEELLALIMKCVNFAAIKHKDQKRKDSEGTPYVNHVIGLKYCYTCIEKKYKKLHILLSKKL